MAMLGLVFTACESNSPVSLDESLEPIFNLQPIDGAQNVEIKLNTGVTSYFKVELSNLTEESGLFNGNYSAWCALWDTPIQANGSTYSGIKMFSTQNDSKLVPLNYFMANKKRFEMENEEMTWREIQGVIWTLLDFPKFDITKIDDDFDVTVMSDVNKEMVVALSQQIIEMTKDMTTNDLDGYAILLETEKDNQNLMIYRTQTPGGWGSPPRGGNPGAYLAANFPTYFGTSIQIGGDETLTFQDTNDKPASYYIQQFLPNGGDASALTSSYKNPTTSGTEVGGVLSGHLLSLALSLGFDAGDPNFGSEDGSLKDLFIIVNASPCYGWTVQKVFDEANVVLGGGGTLTPGDIQGCVALINEEFVDGTTVLGNLSASFP